MVVGNAKTRKIHIIILYFFLGVLGFFMVYPMLWMFASSFRDNREIFTSMSIIPDNINPIHYFEGWQATSQITYGTFFMNTLKIVLPVTVFTVISSLLVAYGFARFQFPLKKFFFTAMLACLMLPGTVVIIPRYLLFSKFGWLDSYLPFIVPAMFAANSFFIFMFVQFLRGIPKDLDEAALIDGCGPLATLTKILLPLCKPAIFSAALFQIIWTWSDFFGPLIYINSVKKYPISLGLRMSLDVGAEAYWNQIMAMSILSILPPILIFFSAQKYFVEGITSGGVKG